MIMVKGERLLMRVDGSEMVRTTLFLVVFDVCVGLLLNKKGI